jgi:phosphate-selective porin OprO/OprP
MNGYAGWTMERQMAIDVIPILADGIKWMGYLSKENILWNVGVYTDWLSHSQSFSTYKWQAAARIAWLPINSPSENTVLHLGLNFRIGDPVNGQMRLRSRPETNPAPYFIDTGTFPTEQSNHFGWEAYYTKGPFMVGTEYYLHKFYSTEEKNPLFRGGDIMMSYVFTGESRPYTTVSGIYSFVPVKKSIFKGGIGAIEAVIRYSQLDLNDGLVTGGKFSRITPMINWYLSPVLRWEFAYGYGILDRYNLKGATQFFQSRVQIVIL